MKLHTEVMTPEEIERHKDYFENYGKDNRRLALLITAEIRLAHVMDDLDSAILGCDRLQYAFKDLLSDDDYKELDEMKNKIKSIRNKITNKVDGFNVISEQDGQIEKSGCPVCGCKENEMKHMMLPILPPIYVKECPNCGWKEERRCD